MRLRNRLFVLVSAVLAMTVVLVTSIVSASARRAFEVLDAQRTAALIAQFRQEFAREGEEIARRLERIAASEELLRTTIEVGGDNPDFAPYVGAAPPLGAAHGLEMLDLVSRDGTIISSAYWPARFGYRHPWAAVDHPEAGTFLQTVEFPGETVLGLVAVRRVVAGDRSLHLAGGRRLDQQFLQSLVLPAGMRVLLYRNVEPEVSDRQLIGQSGAVAPAGQLEPLIARARQLGHETSETIRWPDGSETVHAIPLKGRDATVLGVLLVGSSRREIEHLMARMRWSAAGLGGLGALLGLALSYAVAARVTRPVEQLADAARTVAGGTWDVPIEVRAPGEIGALADAFAVMTRQLVDQRERLMQSERVAAWRELARRLAHELKNPLFPLRLTVDNLRNARALPPDQFREIFEESLSTLSTGLARLNSVIGQFSDFARMPKPECESMAPNEIVRRTLQLCRAQFTAPGRPAIRVTEDLHDEVGVIQADPDQIGRAIQNLLLNAVDAMPEGGEITIRTRRGGEVVHLEVSDTGEGLTEEERQRLFTPYYTTKQFGTGLGLAIVQSIVADHRGKIWVESERGRGTTFHIELPGDA